MNKSMNQRVEMRAAPIIADNMRIQKIISLAMDIIRLSDQANRAKVRLFGRIQI